MKKLLIYLLISAAALPACKKDDNRIFEESPNERAAKALSTYQTQLTGAANGWKAFIEPAGGGTYTFYFKFNDANRVNMYSDFSLTSATTPAESSYRLKALQQPSLLFDTYSYVHVLSDPDPNVNRGVRGAGLRSDFEFYFESASADTIRLVGRLNGSRATLIRATAQEGTAFTGGQLGNSLLFNNIDLYVNYFKRVTINSIEYEINVNTTARTIIFSWLDGSGNVQSFTTSYFYTPTGIQFKTPFIAGNQTITSLTGVTWNGTTNILGFTANGVGTTVRGSGQPIKVDVGAPRRWWQRGVDEDSYWVSLDGFHVDGVDDAYGLGSIPGFGFLLYWPRYGTSGSVNYDLAGYVSNNSIAYGTAYFPPNFTIDGKVIFTALGTLGTVPAAATAKVAATRAKFVDPAGYYFIQTGTDSYDMVSADGRSWITWLW